MRDLERWVNWRYQDRDGKLTKVPYQTRLSGGRRPQAKTTDPTTWAPFDEALTAYRDPSSKLDGIGFVFAEGGGLVGVDFDACLGSDGALLEWARPYLNLIVGYAEVSPSGRGLKVFSRGEVPGGKGRKLTKLGPDRTGAIEIYAQARYFTVTSNSLPGFGSIGEGSAELAQFHAQCFPEKAARPRLPAPTSGFSGSDADLIQKIERSKHGSLWAGSIDGHQSKSEADFALCNILRFWVGRDSENIDRLFRQSGLYDDKWENRADYRDLTIRNALDGDVYDPNRRAANRTGGQGGKRPPVRIYPQEAGERPNETDDDPYRLAKVILAESFRHPDGLCLRRWNGEWHFWNGKSWIVRPDEEVHNEASLTIKRDFDRVSGLSGEPPAAVTMNIVGSTIGALRALANLSLIACERQPSWLGPFEPGEDLPNPEDLIPATNALIDLGAFAQGGDCTLPLSPRFFSSNTLGYAFNPNAPPPSRWLKFLDEVWPDDPESIATLQEWFGYLLTPDTRQQKILMMIGPKRSGKGTIFRVLRMIVGESNVAHPTLTKMSGTFGMECLIGKTLAILPDVRLSHKVDAQVVVEQLLSVSGEDGQTVNRKHVRDWEGKLSVRFVLASNILPRLDDSSGALPDRLILLRLTQSFLGKEDPDLTTSLLTEKPGILLWAIEGWKRLRERGYFVQPESASDLVEDFGSLSSPVGAFVAEMCEVGPDCTSLNEDLFNAWRQWCQKTNREKIGTDQELGRHLHACVPGLKTSRRRKDGAQRPSRKGIGLKTALIF